MEGTPFGRYRLVELLGRGGMGEVWRAFDTAIDRVVALKVLPANFADDQVFQERFRREARAAAGLDEPHVVPIYDFGEIDGRLYVTMRLIKGRDLQALLADGPLDPGRAVGIVEQVAFALDAAHRVGLVHRDVKPSNVLVAEHDFAYLIDFGIARTAKETGLTSTGATIGTWSYMAPERFTTGEIDPRSDIYALACVLHQSLTGRLPFAGDSLEQQMAGHMFAPPPQPSALRPGIPAQMDGVIATGMAKDPAHRYRTTKELAAAARAALTTPQTVPPLPTAPTQPVEPPTRPAAPLEDTVEPPPSRGPRAAMNNIGSQGAVPPPAATGLRSPSGSPPQVPTEPGITPAVERQRPRPWWRRARVVIPTAAILAVVAVVAVIGLTVFPHRGPNGPALESGPATRTMGTVVLVIDVSQSMRSTDVSPSRLEAAAVGAKRFAQRLNPRLNLGLVAFAGTASVLVEPTTDRVAIESAIDQLQLADRTATGEGIFTALQSINVPPGWIVLESDGKQTVPSSFDAPRGAYSAARAAKAKNVIVSTISLGTSFGTVEVSTEEVPVPVDDDSLREIANIAGGSFHSASTIAELNDAYDTLVNEIG